MKRRYVCANGGASWAALVSLGIISAVVLSTYANREASKPNMPPDRVAAETPASPAAVAAANGSGGGVAGTCPGAGCPVSTFDGTYACLIQNCARANTGDSVACGVGGAGTTANQFARCFDLALELPAGTVIEIHSVNWAISQMEHFADTVGAIPIKINVYTDLACPPTVATQTLVATATVMVDDPDEGSAFITPVVDPVTGLQAVVGPGGTLVVEIEATVDGTPGEPIEYAFRPRVSAPACVDSYLLATDCGLLDYTPVSLVGDGFPESQLMIKVNGQIVGATKPVCGNGILEACEECDPPDGANCDPTCQIEPSCGDGVCDVGEDQCNCAPDCGTPPVDETGLCADGIDNDCDGLIDCDDGNDCAADPECVCGPGAGPCDSPHQSPGCLSVDCCAAVCAVNGACCSLNWSPTCVNLALKLCQVPGDPVFIATGPNSNLDAYLDVSPDVYGSYASATFGGQADHYNPVGAGTLQEAAFSSGLYLFRGGTQRELLSDNGDWQDVFPGDQTLDRTVTEASSASDTNGDGVNDTLTSAFVVTGNGIDLAFAVTQHVERIVPLVGNPVAILTQDYTITNNGPSPIDFELVSTFDGDLVWVGDFEDDIVGTGTNDSPGVDRFVFEGEVGQPEASIILSSPTGDAYVGSKLGIIPDPIDPLCVAYGFGTDVQVFQAFGIPDCWRNHIAGLGYDTDGDSGASPLDCGMRCDALILLEIPVTIAAGAAKTTVTITHIYGADALIGEVLPSPGDISGPDGCGFPDGCVDAFDLGCVLGAWCSSAGDPDPPKDEDPPCEECFSPNFAFADMTGKAEVPDGCVDAFDLARVFANWCSVGGGNPCGTCFAP
ncbi:MAG: hypothetical protein IH830_13115 [Planctomycetes bacterium]|nr:hypothetical protein [Planctomycetota bacterium]